MDPLDLRPGGLARALESLLADVVAYLRAGEPFGPTHAGLELWLQFRQGTTAS